MAKDNLADNLNKLKLYDRLGKNECTLKYSKLTAAVLEQLKKYGYIKNYRYEDDKKQGLLHVELNGKINEIGVIKPHFPVKKTEWYEKESLYLPAYNIGILIVSTSQGVLTNIEAREKDIGGRLIAYVY
jgi:small subunit ribosomal protein S8